MRLELRSRDEEIAASIEVAPGEAPRAAVGLLLEAGADAGRPLRVDWRRDGRASVSWGDGDLVVSIEAAPGTDAGLFEAEVMREAGRTRLVAGAAAGGTSAD